MPVPRPAAKTAIDCRPTKRLFHIKWQHNKKVTYTIMLAPDVSGCMEKIVTMASPATHELHKP